VSYFATKLTEVKTYGGERNENNFYDKLAHNIDVMKGNFSRDSDLVICYITIDVNVPALLTLITFIIISIT